MIFSSLKIYYIKYKEKYIVIFPFEDVYPISTGQYTLGIPFAILFQFAIVVGKQQ